MEPIEKIESIVTKYRQFIANKCPKQENGDGCFMEPASPHGDADYQMIATLYSTITGSNANNSITDILADWIKCFANDALSSEELSFLKEHFSEFIEYEFTHGNEWYVSSLCRKPECLSQWSYAEDIFYNLVSNGNTKEPLNIYLSNTNFCDLAVQMKGCVVSGFTSQISDREEVWALGQIRMYAAGIESRINPSFAIPFEKQDYILFSSFYELDWYLSLYDCLADNGHMISVMAEDYVVAATKDGEKLTGFIQKIIQEKDLHSVTHFWGEWLFMDDFPLMLVMIDKAPNRDVTMGISIDGKLAKTTRVSYDCIDPEILWPSYYLTDKPHDGVPLSSIARINDRHRYEYDVNFDNSIKVIDALSDSDNDSFSEILVNSEDLLYMSDFSKEARFYLCQVDKPCVLLRGHGDYYGIKLVHEISDPGYAAKVAYAQLVPKEGVDLLFLAKVMLLPEVKRQLNGFCCHNINAFSISKVLNKVKIPSFSAEERANLMTRTALNSLLDIQAIQEQIYKEYKSTVRMRKHALSQRMSILRANYRTILSKYEQNGKTLKGDDCASISTKRTIDDIFQSLQLVIKQITEDITHIADGEEDFGKIESLNPRNTIAEYISNHEKDWQDFEGIIKGIVKANTEASVSNEMMHPIVSSFYFPKKGLERIFDNIVSNARSHGFSEPKPEGYHIQFSWTLDRGQFKIFVDNDGTPLPFNIDTNSLILPGKSSKLGIEGHEGNGCDEIRKILQKYGGNLFIERIASGNYQVRYVLVFNHYITNQDKCKKPQNND